MSGMSGMSGMSETIVITGLGMRTPVGNDTVQSCASLRARMARLIEWPHLGIGPEEGGVAVAAIEPDLGDAPWPEKAEDLFSQPLHEALWQAGLYDGVEYRKRTGKKIGAYLALPTPVQGRVEPDGLRRFAIEARKHCIAPAQADVVELHHLDHVATASVAARSVEALTSGEVGVAVVGAMDSHLSATWLQALYERRCLKHAGSPVGFIPGEAGVFLILETERAARARGVTPLGRLTSIGLDRETVPLGGALVSRGDGLTRAVRACLAAAGGGNDVERVITDINGERWRSAEYSVVATRCLTALPRSFIHWHPADCVGDTGAASGALAVGMAVRGFARGYAGRGGVLILSSSPTGERAALVVGRA